MNGPDLVLRSAVHFSAAANFAIAIVAQLNSPAIPEDVLDAYSQLNYGRFGGSWKYLTFWNMWFQLAFFSVCLVNDCRGKAPGKGTTIRDRSMC